MPHFFQILVALFALSHVGFPLCMINIKKKYKIKQQFFGLDLCEKEIHAF